MEKEKHSKEVQELRGLLISRIIDLDKSRVSKEDAMFLLSVIYDCMMHLRNTSGGD